MCNKVLCYHTSSCVHVLCFSKTFSFLKSKYWKGTAIFFFPLFNKYLNVTITVPKSTCEKQLFVLCVIIGKFVEVACQHFMCFLLFPPGGFFFNRSFLKIGSFIIIRNKNDSLPETCNFA